MKKIKTELIAFLIITLVFLLISPFVFSQAPEKMSYQAIIKDSEGKLVNNQTVDIRLQIIQDSIYIIQTHPDSTYDIFTSYIVVYDEKFRVNTDADGLVKIEIGSGNVILNPFNTIDWSKGPCTVQFEVAPNGEEKYTIYWKNPLTTVPYAFYAKTAGIEDEKDSVFSNSVAGKITASDINKWNANQDSIIESDPVFSQSAAKEITISDTSGWNRKLGIESQHLGNVLSKGNSGGWYRLKQIDNPVEQQDVATKAYVDVLKDQIDNLTRKINSYYAGGIVTDIDGNQYNTVRIGNQIWMAENLRTAKFNDSSAIPVSTDNQWQNLTTSVYCWYNNDETKYKIPYGAYYNYYAVATKKLCPVGWRVPDNFDWEELTTYLGGSTVAGGKLKTIGNKFWDSPNAGADNSSGFNAVAGGNYSFYSKISGFDFTNMKYSGRWWSSTFENKYQAFDYSAFYYDSYTYVNSISWQNGQNVRCIKEYDSTTVHRPLIYSDPVFSITDTSAIVRSVISSEGGSQITIKGICWDTLPIPDTTKNTIFNTDNGNEFTIPITGLSGDKRYYIRSFAGNKAGIRYSNCLNFVTTPGTSYLADIDGNYYKTVKIGNQTWMAENLRTTKLNDGSPIAYGYSKYATGYKWYNHDSTYNRYVYGGLYGRDIVNSDKLCPTGWHVPTNAEWETLADILGGMDSAGGKMKETGTAHWTKPNTGATNESDFTALPGGYYYQYEGSKSSAAEFVGLGSQGVFSSVQSTGFLLSNTAEKLSIYNSYHSTSTSVRCKMDDLETVTIPEISTNEVSNIFPWTANSGGTVISDGGSVITQKGICWSDHSNPDTNNFKTKDGYSSNKYTSFISNLLPKTTYYVRSYAINKVGITYGNELSFTTKDDFNYGSVTDIDGNTYKTIKIINQTWMAENLKSTHFNNGDSIPNITDNKLWELNTSGAYCNLNNLPENGEKFGKLYNYYTVNDSRKVCPAGWHVPNSVEWTTLIDNMGGSSKAGIKLLEAGNAHWSNENKATNETGFTAIQAGSRYNWGYFGSRTSWWSSNNYDVYAYVNSMSISSYSNDNTDGYSIRCLKDVALDSVEIPKVYTDSASLIYQHIATASGKISSDGGSVIIEKGICWDTIPSPAKEKNKISLGSSTAPFSCLLKNLKANTTYYVRAYATNNKGTAYGNEQVFTTKEEHPYGSITDIDGNTYKTIQIGKQIWMAENLKTTKYSNGDSIGTTMPSNKSIYSESEPKYQWASMNDESKVNSLGRLYTWYVATDSRNVCPTGWHVPDDVDLSALIDTLGGETIAGIKVKDASTVYFDWNSSSLMATNESGFSALPAGHRSYDGYYPNYGCYLWSIDQYDSSNAECRYISAYYSSIYPSAYNKKYALSIRCLKD